MNSRERVLTALLHQPPDRVPIDFGSTVDTTIMAMAYPDLRKHLGLGPVRTRVSDIYQQTALVDEDVRQALGADLFPVFYEPREWRSGTLPDGSPAEFPREFRPQLQPDGSWLVIDAEGNTLAMMPENGLYFDPIHAPLADATDAKDVEKHIQHIVNYDTPSYLDKSFEELAKQAKRVRETTDYALVGFFGGHILQAGQVLRGWETFLMDLLENQQLAHAIMEKLLEANLDRLGHYAATVGKYLDVIHFEEDLGMQDRPLLGPETFRRMLKPYMKRLFSFAKSRCDAYLLLHTDGAIEPLIPDFIEMGVDAINPVQVSAVGMDTRKLKKEFGQDITFWGGGCDSQRTLPFGTSDEVAEEVKRRINDLACGGGFVFSTVHNVQIGTPLENLLTMFRTAQECGICNS
jgi:uroporphyrinogen decarboxylase